MPESWRQTQQRIELASRLLTFEPSERDVSALLYAAAALAEAERITSRSLPELTPVLTAVDLPAVLEGEATFETEDETRDLVEPAARPRKGAERAVA
jgi:hypothetical protein